MTVRKAPTAELSPVPSQAVADTATEAESGQVSQLSQSQPGDFPIEVLPERVRSLVLEAASALGVDPAMVAGPCLAVLAGCIGNRRRIILKLGTWCEACVLWITTVMRSGGGKTPANGLVLKHLQEREAAEIQEEKRRRAEHEDRLRGWNAAPRNQRGEEPEKPEPASRILVSDITTEGLLFVHERAPLGLLLYRDELGGWLLGFNQYKSGKGSDAQTWTEMHQGKPCLIDRKGSGTLSVPRAAVSIVGGIQPELLRKALWGDHLYDGIASRLLFVVPPDTTKRWTEETISEEARQRWDNLLDELIALQPNGDGTPMDLPIASDAKEIWVTYYNDHAQHENAEDGPMRSAMSKLEGATARLALVIQLASDPQSIEVGVEAMKAGIAISNWFEGQARRVYQGFKETDQERDRREVCDWIREQGGKTTRHMLANRGPNRFRKGAGKMLDDLVNAGLAKLQGREYVLCDCDTCDREAQ